MELGRGRFRNVVSIGMRGTAMTFPAVAQIDAYWEGLRQGRPMPARTEVDPRGMEGALEYAMLMEVVAPGVARIRVSGLHMGDLLGMEVRGMPITAFFEPEDRTQLSALVDLVAAGRHVVEATLSSSGGIGRPPLDARLYLAPLEAERDKRPRLLACLQSRGDIGRTPRRFKIADYHKRRIVASAGGAFTTPTPAPAAEIKQQAFAEPAASFEAAAPSSERPHLRLVKSDS